MSLSNSVLFFSRVNNKHSRRYILHFLDTAEELFKLLVLKVQLNNLFLGKKVHCSVFSHLFKLIKTLDSLFDCLKVCKHTAEPACIYIVHTGSFSLFADCVLSLLLCSDKENASAFCCDVANKIVRFLNFLYSLLQVDDIDTVSLGKNILRHFRVPAACLMSEVNTCLQKLLHLNYSHDLHLHSFTSARINSHKYRHGFAAPLAQSACVRI